MPKTIVITDTSCLIVLTKLNIIGILHNLYPNIVVTENIADEFGEQLPPWITVKSISNKRYQQLLEATLDKGEASAIALALELEDALLIIDDLKGRKEATRLGLKITGTLGLLMKAKQLGYLDNINTYLNQLEIVGFRISSEIKNEILRECGEI